MVAILGNRRLDDDFLHEVGARITPAAQAVHRLLKGPEVPLPQGVHVGGRLGSVLTEMRIRWWCDGRGKSYQEACINRHQPGPDIPIAAEFAELLTPRHDHRLPIFIGHYWLAPGRPAPLSSTVACLDYSVAAGGPLVAYRWDGEAQPLAEKFVYDPTLLPRSKEATFLASLGG
jgi:hypothetical protein